MKNISHSPVTEMLSGKYRIWLMVCLAALFATDVTIAVYAGVTTMAVRFAIPCVAAAVDGLFLLVTVFSNQRFKYARKYFVIYAIAKLCCVVCFIATRGVFGIYYTSTITLAFIVLQICGVIAAAITYAVAARLFASRVCAAILAAISLAFLGGVAVVYDTVLFSGGYSGQGAGLRPVVFEDNNDGTYTAVAAEGTYGDTIVIPKEFNGNKVTAVSCDIFAAQGIKSVRLDCDATVKLENSKALRRASDKLIINVPKKNAQAFRDKFFSYTTDSSVGAVAAINMANLVRPCDLAYDAVYITFSYDVTSYQNAGGKAIPIWYGKKGDVFSIKDITSVGYCVYSDSSSDADLLWNYGNNRQKIISELSIGGKKLDGAIVSESKFGVPVSFAKIYKVKMLASNDTRFDATALFDYTYNNGVKCDYKLILADKADELLSPYVRNGFSLSWRYFNGMTAIVGSGYLFNALSDVLSDSNSEVSIRPDYELDSPTAEISASLSGNVTYGDKLSLTAVTSHTLGNEITYKYSWKQNGTVPKGSESILGFNKAVMSDAGTYSLQVTAESPQTSRTSSATASYTVNVVRRPVTVTFSEKNGSVVYDGNKHTVTATLANTVVGDDIGLSESTFEFVNAGFYTKNVSLAGTAADCYQLVAPTTFNYTVQKKPVDVGWGTLSWTYDDNNHIPTASATGVGGVPLVVNVRVSGYSICVNAGSYTATAVFDDDNYSVTPTTSSRTFVINRYPVTVRWSGDSFIYNGNLQAPTASATGVGGAPLEVNVSGKQRNAGTGYVAVASLSNANYTVDSGGTRAFSIQPYDISVAWSGMRLVYNGNPQAPTASATGVGGAKVALTITGSKTDAGAGYTAYASASSDYRITSGESCVYSIEKKDIAVVWSNTALVYNGNPQAPTASATGVKGEQIGLTVTGSNTNAGAGYTATVAITSNANYSIASGESCAYSIAKKGVTATWSNTSFVYNGRAQAPTVTVLGVNNIPLATSVTGARTNVGSGTATVSVFDSNYAITSGATQDFSIAKKAVTVTVRSVTVDYGTTPDYTYTQQGVIEGDAITVSCRVTYTADQSGNIPSGTYMITATIDNAENYDVTVTTGTLIVREAPAEVV